MKVEISTWSVIKILLILLGLWLLWEIRDILVLLFVVIILVAGLRPIVAWFVARGIPRLAAVSGLTLMTVGGFLVILSLIIPAIITQLQIFVFSEFPIILQKISPYYESITQGRQLLNELINQLQAVSGNIVTGVVSIFGGLVSALTVLVLTFYLLLEPHPLTQTGIMTLLPPKYQQQLASSLGRISEKLGAWLRGQFLLSLIIGLLTAVAMSLIGVPAPLAIGLIAGLLEVVPIVGPLIAGIIMVMMAAVSPEAALLKVVISLGFAVGLQFLEAHLLVPNIMKQAIGVSPVVVIIALLVGSQLGGITGAIIAIPAAAILQVAAQDWPKFKRASREH